MTTLSTSSAKATSNDTNTNPVPRRPRRRFYYRLDSRIGRLVVGFLKSVAKAEHNHHEVLTQAFGFPALCDREIMALLNRHDIKDLPKEPHLYPKLKQWVVEDQPVGLKKLAMALLGIFGNEQDLPLILQACKTENLIHTGLEAISRLCKDNTEALRMLASTCDPSARYILARYLTGTQDEQLRDWLFNQALPEHDIIGSDTAYIAATNGRLLERLQKPYLSEPELQTAGNILWELLDGIDYQMEDYHAAPQAICLWLEHLARIEHPMPFEFLNTTLALQEFATGCALQSEPVHHSWNGDCFRRINVAYDQILKRDHWHELMTRRIESGCEETQLNSLDAMFALGIPLSHWIGNLEKHFNNTWFWTQLAIAGKHHPKDVLNAADQHFHLHKPQARNPRRVACPLLAMIAANPGEGIKTWTHCMQSEIEDYRLNALHAANVWPKPQRMIHHDLISKLSQEDASQEIRELAAKVLNGPDWQSERIFTQVVAEAPSLPSDLQVYLQGDQWTPDSQVRLIWAVDTINPPQITGYTLVGSLSKITDPRYCPRVHLYDERTLCNLAIDDVEQRIQKQRQAHEEEHYQDMPKKLRRDGFPYRKCCCYDDTDL